MKIAKSVSGFHRDRKPSSTTLYGLLEGASSSAREQSLSSRQFQLIPMFLALPRRSRDNSSLGHTVLLVLPCQQFPTARTLLRGLGNPSQLGEKARREKALDFSGCNSRPGTGSLHPVAIETAAEATKLPELSMERVAWRLRERAGHNMSER